ncbi:HAD-IIA family hydrolase [Halopiger djelfimassiliensis]|uniref:HAD-IIA family hydrolase n=1 Tax=Halopiger djelfimassiliensis TaxID=1293047 RepID=UPI0006775C6E|nr:HAD-IIA family hydrolase [Halopiger djelfimassiliensis]
MTSFEGAIVDLDGTVYLGDELIEGVREGIECLRSSGTEVLFLTNNPIRRRSDYRDRLRSFGIDVVSERIVTSGSIAAEYLATRHPDAATYVVGESALVAELRDADVPLTTEPNAAEVVLASMDRSFEYADLREVLEAFDGESAPTFYATNPDRTCPTADGPIPDAAAMIGAIEGATGHELDAVLGKPSPTAVETAAGRLETAPENCLVVGDRIGTDIRMGNRAGMTTALVLSGVTDSTDVSAASTEPDYVLESLGQVDSVLRS